MRVVRPTRVLRLAAASSMRDSKALVVFRAFGAIICPIPTPSRRRPAELGNVGIDGNGGGGAKGSGGGGLGC